MPESGNGDLSDVLAVGAKARWPRVVLKISGEALASSSAKDVVDADVLDRLAQEVAKARQLLDVEIAIVVGGGNIWRGTSGTDIGLDRATSDHMGMLGTTMNSLALQNAIERLGQPTRVQTAIEMAELAEPYIRRRAIRHLEKGRVVILAAGMGSPYFTTDTAAALRAAEIGAAAVLKGTHSGVDGIYSADPKLDSTATKFEELSYMDVISKGLQVMDLTAITFCQDNKIEILVFDVSQPGNVLRAMAGVRLGTLVR
ncbi:MAG: UMP kinase [Acidimicrobiaceae bacterium]|nr:UMP kinase [Acidimicrobiaceae bacterium]